MMRIAGTSCMLALIAMPVAQAAAQTYPSKPIRLVVPFGAGSNTDILARTMAVRMAESWGQQVVVDNRPGAGGRPRAVNRVPACGMRTSASGDACR